MLTGPSGQSLTIEASGTLHKAVEKGAMVEVTVKYGLITLIKETLDLCDHVSEVDLECPIKKDKLVLTKVVDIPKQVPPVSTKFPVFGVAFAQWIDLICVLD